MSVQRLSKRALKQILAGDTIMPATCIVKFYSNDCPMCHNLREYYEEIAEKDTYTDLHFFAFNVDDYPNVEKLLNFNGTPSIFSIRTGAKKPKIRALADPETPHKHTWYRVKDIINFIEKEK
jgi:hypothetical protein